MKFGVWLPAMSGLTDAGVLDAVGVQLEERNIDSVWVGEHLVLFDEYASSYPYAADGRLPTGGDAGLLEPFTVLTYLAARTTRVRLGTAVMLLPQRNPVYTAKTTASLDFLSGGRLDLGIGVGWLREEFEAAGVPWEHRGRRTDEYVRLLRTLWTEDPSAFDGEFYSLAECRMHPKPTQQPPPIHVGGESDAALRRVAKHGDGWFTFNRPPGEVAEPMARLGELLAENGRARSEVTVSACPYMHGLTPEMVREYAAAGVDQVVALLFAFDAAGVEQAFDGFDACREAALGS